MTKRYLSDLTVGDTFSFVGASDDTIYRVVRAGMVDCGMRSVEVTFDDGSYPSRFTKPALTSVKIVS